jgi:hypothetical protein
MSTTDEFSGLTATNCCAECAENAARGEPKVISGADHCLHRAPIKSSRP